MSYDLAVFDPKAAPTNVSEFLSWYGKQTQWSEPHGYDDPSVSSNNLRMWFFEMIETFPAMNGKYAASEEAFNDPEIESCISDYSVGKEIIYVAFAWSKAESAYEQCFRLANKHKVGFFDVSDDRSSVFFPDESGELKCLFQANEA